MTGNIILEWLRKLWQSIRAWAEHESPWDEPGPHDHYQGSFDDFDGGDL
jgi:hypothetical protein